MSSAQLLAASVLNGLNPAQLQVQCAPQTPIQILAGPGSGKTKVLTSRIAYLILHQSIPPASICAVTFTNKAANEMRTRLTMLIGKERTGQLKMGTFHALCARFLRIHSTLAGIDSNFTICDSEESKKIISSILKKHKEYIEEKKLVLTDSGVLSMISKGKAKGKFYTNIINPLKDLEYIMGLIYDAYERTLRHNNSLDFDDLLLYGVKLFKHYKHTVSWCNHVLVDEFQDTNTTQYDLMIALASKMCVTVVGDPDQSIYGWRSAEVENLARMCKDFPGTRQVFLEQNYRSTGSILRACLAIVAQDKTRIQKLLHTSHPRGSIPFLRPFATEHKEAQFIAIEIKRFVAYMGGVLGWGDIAILLRFNALSRVIESALQKHGIPNRVLGGHKFFERQEIRNVLAYLQLVDNPSFNPALVRAANVPSRGIGEKTLQEIAARAEKSGRSHLSIMEGICDGTLPDLKPSIKRKLDPFVRVVHDLCYLANKGTAPADLIRRLLETVEFENHLRKTQPDWESRWENVKELITFASEVENNIIAVEKEASMSEASDTSQETPLRLFLQASMLSSEGDNENEDSKNKVTISTCHAAKGLEWPVVFVPSVEQGTFPFARSEDEEEERRLLYVACTRAQGLLYLSHAQKRAIAGNAKDRNLSGFISAVVEEDPTLFSNSRPTFLPADQGVICDILNRQLPTEAEVTRRVADFEKTIQHYLVDDYTVETHGSSHPLAQMVPMDLSTSFTSSSAVLHSTKKITTTSRVSERIHWPPLGVKASSSHTSAKAATSTHPAQRAIANPPLVWTSPPSQTSSNISPSYTSLHSNLSASSPVITQQSTLTHSPHTSVRSAILAHPTRRTAVNPPRTLFNNPHLGSSTSHIISLPLRSTPVGEGHAAVTTRMHPLLHSGKNGLPSHNQNIPPSLPPVAPPQQLIPATHSVPLMKAPTLATTLQGTKRRLGMGRAGQTSYTNKKFKQPT